MFGTTDKMLHHLPKLLQPPPLTRSQAVRQITASVTVTVISGLTVTVSPDNQDICVGDSTTLTASSAGNGVGYSWDTGPNSAMIMVSPAATSTYSVTGTDAQGCSGTATAVVNVNPLPVVSFTADPLVGCEPTTVNFTDLSTGNIAIWDWEFGDGEISGVQNPSHSYSSGTYSVTLTATTGAGCQSSLTMNNYITVMANPIASFAADPPVTTEDNPTITFLNQTTGATLYSWDFGDGSGSTTTENPIYTYEGTGEYAVTLWVENAAGCIDSTKAGIIVKPTFIFYIPNSFSPNKDGRNEVFMPKGIGWNLDAYSMRIYDRWGELVFSTTDVNHGWDGYMPNGTEAQMGVYSVRIYIKGLDLSEHTYSRALTLIK